MKDIPIDFSLLQCSSLCASFCVWFCVRFPGMFLFFGLCLLIKALAAKDCSQNITLVAPTLPARGNFTILKNRTCGWYITAPENNVVFLDFVSAVSSLLSFGDSIEFYDVSGSSLTRIPFHFPDRGLDRYRYRLLYSKFRSVYVAFKSGGNTDDELTIEYSSLHPVRSCSSGNSYEENMGILLKDSSGTITTPGFPQGYNYSLIAECSWKILAPAGNVVRVDFISFSLAKYDYVTIADALPGWNLDQSIRLSGQKASFTVFSMGNELSINVFSLYGTSGPGFVANFTSVPTVIAGTCDPTQNSIVQVDGDGLTFSTPGFPSFPGKGTCTWNITVPIGQFIKLTFWKNYGECKENYVNVFDGTNSTRISLGKFCNKYIEEVVFSKGNSLLVEYNSRRKAYYNGFLATYETIKERPADYSCLGEKRLLEDDQGEFASFSYPLHYPNNAKCSWYINRPVGFIIQLTFHSFNLQQSKNCEGDYVEIRQSKDEYEWRSELIGRFCGYSLPPVIVSNQSNVFVKFVADMSKMYPGFHASYKVLANPAMGACKNPGQNNVIPLTSSSGSLFSPLYPEDYPTKIMCTWVITVPEGYLVRLRIKAFRLGYSCGSSSLKIFDGKSSSSNLLKKFCGKDYNFNVFSSGRHLLVQYDSRQEYLVGDVFFDAVFEAVDRVPASISCTERFDITKLETKTGELASYNYPLPYDDDVKCIWLIIVDSNYEITLSFDYFNLSRSSGCSDDYVEVRDGQFDTSELVGKFCGADIPESITSDSWDMHLTFKSSGKTKYPGFKASYKTKMSTGAILKIVGYCVGGLALTIALIGGCFKCYLMRKASKAVLEELRDDKDEDFPLQEQATG